MAATGAFPVVNTIAGGVGGPALATSVAMGAITNEDNGASVAAFSGSDYVSSGEVIWRLNPSNDWLTPVAGIGSTDEVGDSSEGAPGLRASLASAGMGGDSNGNLLEADAGTNRVRLVAAKTGTFFGQSMTAGHIYTIAGDGTMGDTGDGGPALKAELSGPQGVTGDAAGNVVITDTGNKAIRVVAAKTGTFYGKAMTAGDIYTVYTGTAASHLDNTAVSKSGNLVIDDSGGGTVLVLAEKTGTFYGQPMTAGKVYPVATVSGGSTSTVALDGAGNAVFSSENSSSQPVVQVLAASTGEFYGQAMTAGQVYTVAGGGSSTTDGVPALQASIYMGAVAVDGAGNLLVENGTQVVAAKTGTFYGKAMTAGDIYTIAGTGHFSYFSGDAGPATSATMLYTTGTAVDSAGNILMVDSGNGRVRVLAETTGSFYGQSMTKGDIYTIAGGGTQGGNGVPALQANLGYPISSLAIDKSGNVVVNSGSGAFVIAERTGLFYGLEMITGHVYDVGDFSANGPVNVTFDHYGNMVFSVVTPSPQGGSYTTVTVLAVKSGTFYGIAMTAGKFYQVAGASATWGCAPGGASPAATFGGVPGLKQLLCGSVYAVGDASGNLVLSVAGNNLVSVLADRTGMYYGQAMKAGYIYDVAGTGTRGVSGNGGPALKAELNQPNCVAVDGSGDIVVADTYNNEIRVVAEKTGVFYGVSMKAGDIYRVAGTGKPAFGGDGGLAVDAWFANPQSVSVTPTGGLLVSDDNRVRLIP
jgi:hypothetical protein